MGEGLAAIIGIVILLFFALRGRQEITDAKLGRVTIVKDATKPQSELQAEAGALRAEVERLRSDLELRPQPPEIEGTISRSDVPPRLGKP
jgi:hypothetical protein